ncbi:unnamed protein product, partial [Rotaria sp. Silwood2]
MLKKEEPEPLLDKNQIKLSSSRIILCAYVPARYTIAMWAFFGFFCLYAMRVNLSVAIVAMVARQSALNKSIEAFPITEKDSIKPSP